MLTLQELEEVLIRNNAKFEILSHDRPILSTSDATGLFDTTKAAPIFILKTEDGLIAFITSFQRGKIDFNALKEKLCYSKLKFADKKEVLESTGYEIGEVGLIGHNLSCLFDRELLKSDFIYGGTGDAFHTLKIAPEDVIKLQTQVKVIDF